MSTRDYSRYSFSDFLEDDFFIHWVILPDEESDLFWKSFLLQYPDKEKLIKQASSVILVYRQQLSFTNNERKDALWMRIGATLDSERPVRSITPVVSFYRKMAAVIALMITTGGILWLLSGRQQSISTEYGEVKTITLPDQSTVTLNGNSSLKYSMDWDSLSVREVWLEGEAYFNVAHINKDTSDIPQGHRFIVHSDAVNLEVLGTTFNVEHRKDHTNITLLSGKVKVQLDADFSKLSQGLIMSPGDQVEYVKKMLVEKRKIEKIKTVTAWINHEFAFVNPRLKDIVNTLRDDHGYEIEISEELMLLPIEGDISVSGIPELLSTIEAILGLRIEVSDKHLLITRR